MAARGIIVAAYAVLGAAVVGGIALTRLEAESDARLSSNLWRSHPAVLRAAGMAEVGQAAARGRNPNPATMARFRKLAARDPLAPEPFLVEAALAAKAGQVDRSRTLLLDARRRDPRSHAARYLLATHYLLRGEARPALEEIAALSRLLPQATANFAPGIAAFAQEEGGVVALRQVLADYPHLEQPVLNVLAADPANVRLVLGLASQARDRLGRRPAWQSSLLGAMVARGDYVRAYALWARLSGVAASRGLFRPDFQPSDAPRPFNWVLAQLGGGLAEPLPGGGLQVSHYGRDTLVLARQMTVLAPGRYRLAMQVGGDSGTAGQMRWQVRCHNSRTLRLDLPVATAGAQLTGDFVVPADGCAAQEIALIGQTQDAATSADVQVRNLRLARVAA